MQAEGNTCNSINGVRSMRELMSTDAGKIRVSGSGEDQDLEASIFSVK